LAQWHDAQAARGLPFVEEEVPRSFRHGEAGLAFVFCGGAALFGVESGR